MRTCVVLPVMFDLLWHGRERLVKIKISEASCVVFWPSLGLLPCDMWYCLSLGIGSMTLKWDHSILLRYLRNVLVARWLQRRTTRVQNVSWTSRLRNHTALTCCSMNGAQPRSYHCSLNRSLICLASWRTRFGKTTDSYWKISPCSMTSMGSLCGSFLTLSRGRYELQRLLV